MLLWGECYTLSWGGWLNHESADNCWLQHGGWFHLFLSFCGASPPFCPECALRGPQAGTTDENWCCTPVCGPFCGDVCCPRGQHCYLRAPLPYQAPVLGGGSAFSPSTLCSVFAHFASLSPPWGCCKYPFSPAPSPHAGSCLHTGQSGTTWPMAQAAHSSHVTTSIMLENVIPNP